MARLSLETVRRLVRYNHAAYDSFERAVRRLGWSAATKNLEIGHLSLKDTLVHILNVQEVWMLIVPEKRWEAFDDESRRPGSIRDWADLSKYQRRVWKGIEERVAILKEADLRRPVKAPWMPGRYSFEEGVYQATFEEAHHLGEIIGAFWQMDRRPPQMMWLPLVLGTRVSVG